MKRRSFLKLSVLTGAGVASVPGGFLAGVANAESPSDSPVMFDAALAQNWRTRWEEHILGTINNRDNRYCDRELGEEIGWLISPFLNAFYQGYLATHDLKWVGRLADWAEAWISRGVKEPDGFIGWPKRGTGGLLERDFLTDSLVGEAMGFRPLVRMAREIMKAPALNETFGAHAEVWLNLAARTFEKWDARGCWREVKGGGLWVVPAFGLDPKTGGWTDGYARRTTDGFSNPDNKQHHIARWLLALHDATGKPVYRERAEKWFRLMKSRMKTQADGKYFVWNYWEPAGPWDYLPDGSTRHWVGVHPNGGYYEADVSGIVAAFEHGLVFQLDDLHRLVATNRDFMWNHQFKGARFQRLDGGMSDVRWKDSPGMLWSALVPYDDTLRNIFLENHDPASWGGLVVTPWFLAREAGGPESKLGL